MARCRDQYGRYYYCNNRWNDWVRWVVLAVVVVGFFLLFVLCRYVSSTPQHAMSGYRMRLLLHRVAGYLDLALVVPSLFSLLTFFQLCNRSPSP